MRSSVILDAGCAEHVSAWQWMFGQISETAKAGRLTDVLRSTAPSAIKIVHLAKMEFTGDGSLICCR
jgi:hypothetical protein